MSIENRAPVPAQIVEASQVHSAIAAIALLMEAIELVPHRHLPHQWLDAHRAGRQALKDLGGVS